MLGKAGAPQSIYREVLPPRLTSSGSRQAHHFLHQKTKIPKILKISAAKSSWCASQNSLTQMMISSSESALVTIILKSSMKQEREDTEAYCPSTNYHLPDDYSRPPKRKHINSYRPSTSRNQYCGRAATLQEKCQQLLHQKCKWHPKGTHSTYECWTLRKALGAPMLPDDHQHE